MIISSEFEIRTNSGSEFDSIVVMQEKILFSTQQASPWVDIVDENNLLMQIVGSLND